jgi:hypothetical protein
MYRISLLLCLLAILLLYLFSGRSEKTWNCWCISKDTNGNACNWYTYVGTKEIKKCATYKGYESSYHLSSHFALKSEDHSLNLLFQHQTFALWSACNVGIANIAKRERNKGAKQLDALMKVSPWCCVLLTQFIHFGYWETLCLSGTFSTTENIHWKLP